MQDTKCHVIPNQNGSSKLSLQKYLWYSYCLSITLWYFSGEICVHKGLPKSTQSLHTTETALAWTRESGSNIASIFLAMCCKFCQQVNSLKKSTLFTRSILTEKYRMSLVRKRCFRICRLWRSISNPTEFTSHTDTVFGIPLHSICTIRLFYLLLHLISFNANHKIAKSWSR